MYKRQIYIRHDYILAAAGSLLLTFAVIWFMNRTKTGVAIKATSMNKTAAQLMGINTNRIFAITFGLSGACVGAAAALMSTFTPIYPEACALYSTLAFVIVALGGFGNIKGCLLYTSKRQEKPCLPRDSPWSASGIFKDFRKTMQ